MPSLTCDAKDRHVLAAAIQGRATTIITVNLRDFPPPLLPMLSRPNIPIASSPGCRPHTQLPCGDCWTSRRLPRHGPRGRLKNCSLPWLYMCLGSWPAFAPPCHIPPRDRPAPCVHSLQEPINGDPGISVHDRAVDAFVWRYCMWSHQSRPAWRMRTIWSARIRLSYQPPSPLQARRQP